MATSFKLPLAKASAKQIELIGGGWNPLDGCSPYSGLDLHISEIDFLLMEQFITTIIE